MSVSLTLILTRSFLSSSDVLLHPGRLPLRRLQLLRQQPRPLWVAQHQLEEGVPQGEDDDDDDDDV